MRQYKSKVKIEIDNKDRGEVELLWDVCMIDKEYGIASLSPFVPSQEIEVSSLEFDPDFQENVLSQTESEMIKLDDVEIKYDAPSDELIALGLIPVSIEIYNGKTSVIFGINSV